MLLVAASAVYPSQPDAVIRSLTLRAWSVSGANSVAAYPLYRGDADEQHGRQGRDARVTVAPRSLRSSKLNAERKAPVGAASAVSACRMLAKNRRSRIGAVRLEVVDDSLPVQHVDPVGDAGQLVEVVARDEHRRAACWRGR